MTSSFPSHVLLHDRSKEQSKFSLQQHEIFLLQIAELNIRHEQEKAQTLRAYQIERDSSLKEHEQEKVSKVPPCLKTFIHGSFAVVRRIDRSYPNNTPANVRLGIPSSLVLALIAENAGIFDTR